DASWASNIDFLFHPERAFMSEIRSSVNISMYSNTTHVVLPTPRVPPEGVSDRMSVSITFVNFCFALTCFLVRYASVFWYTNKLLTAIFALQLLAMELNSIFSFNCFSTLYCVCYNKTVFPNVHLSLSCVVDLVLYLFGSTILMLSTMAVFEYGSHYFHEKFKIVERHHNPESYIKQTIIANSGCQGYVPHLCAIATLVVFAVCKGPLLYELVSLMRLTGDQLLLSGVVCEVCYMVLWVALWFGLTIKQQWKFRILDYVPLRQPMHLLSGDGSSKHSHHGHGDSAQSDSLTRSKRLSGRENFTRYLETGAPGTNSSGEDTYHSDIGTDDSDVINSAEMVLDLDGNLISDSGANFRRSRQRRNCGQRVTFDESVRGKGSAAGGNHTPTSSLTRQGAVGGFRQEDANHLNITADIHAILPPPNNESLQEVTLRSKPPDTAPLSREYRNSIRSKCGEYYSSTNNLSASFDEGVAGSSPPDALPTLMSSFRDKVRVSSIAASSFKDRERQMLEHAVNDGGYGFDTSDKYRSNSNSHNRQENQDVYYRFDSNLNDGGYPYDSSTKSSSLTRKAQHNSSLSSDDEQRSSCGNSTVESSEISLPPLMEEIQISRVRTGSGTGKAGGIPKENYPHHHMVGGKVEYRALHSHAHSRPVHLVVGKKSEIGRRDSANYSLTSSQDNSSNESDHGHGLCSQV
ncbi:unnamed protein product, partial [Lymnaea stagnalis]